MDSTIAVKCIILIVFGVTWCTLLWSLYSATDDE